MAADTHHIRRGVPCLVLWALMMVAAVVNGFAANPISIENALAGNLASEWDISGAGDPSIQGFATEISVNKGETVRFKVDTDARDYQIDIYRLGYYQGRGARRITTVTPSVTLPQRQPQPLSDSATGLVDCGNWAVSASWNVPANATSGVYIGKLVRKDTGGASHMVFVVRDDAGNSDILFQTSDATWQAYNKYGGNSLYVGAPAGRAYKVSYNRPFITRAGETSRDWVFNAEYPMIRWLEANGYNVSYSTGVDTDRRGALLKSHKMFLSVGHDEYWSGAQRANVEAARNAGVHLGFFSGNEMFWKTRWEPSIDGSGTPYRTLVCYKETHDSAKIDPASVWTGTWRDPRFSPPADGGKPENAVTGTLFMVNGPRADAITVPALYGAHRFWRNTSVASLSGSQTASLPAGTLGYEWDESPVNGWQPAGLMRLSSTTVNNVPLLRDYGSTYTSGQATHSLSLYRHSSGALVFGAGTVQWSWGLDGVHDNGSAAADVRIQQATVNLFADMGGQPETLRSGLTQATASTDSATPTSTVLSPANGTIVQAGTPVQITGTASDVGGRVWGVEVSVDGGNTWQPASGRENWSLSWVPPATGPASIKSRAFDDSGNVQSVSSGGGGAPEVVSLWASTSAPATVDGGPDKAAELGVKFRSDVAGVITGIRFYKAATNTGTHVGSLWSSTGTRLAFATFPTESASGWQQVNFSTPVPIQANTVYVASYHCPAGHYSADERYFATNGVDRAPLHALANGVSGGNGIFRYGPAGTFPNQSWNAANYWVDVVFEPTLSSITVTPSNPSLPAGATQQFTATGTYPDGSSRDLSNQVAWSSSQTAVATIDAAGLAKAVSTGTSTITAKQGSVSGTTSLTVAAEPLTITTASLPGGTVNAAYTATLAASNGTPPRSWSVTSGSLPPGLTLAAASGAISGTPGTSGTFNFTVQVRDASTPAQTATKALSIVVSAPAVISSSSFWASTARPTTVDGGPDKAAEVGVKFRSDVAGVITGIRFYKAATNTGTHVGSLWSSTGTRLAFATFPTESASGWQQVNFSTPVPIQANTVYVASYHCPAGHYSADERYFATNGVDRAPLHALANGVSGGNGVFRYGPAGTFPNQTWNSANYWVDVVFEPTLSSITVTPSNPSVPVGATQQFTATGTYPDGSSRDLSNQVTWSSSKTAVATIDSAGLAKAVSTGTSTITATLGSVSGTTSLTITAEPLTITTASLPGGTVNEAYTATLAASNGTPPRSWSVTSGSLPPGLTLDAASGAISGIPEASGTFNFTVQVRDAGTPVQTATKALSIAVSAPPSSSYSFWASTSAPTTVDGGPDKAAELGVKFRSDVAGVITGIRFYKAATNTGTHVGSLWSSTGTRLAFATFPTESASGWQQVNFSTPVPIQANTVYVASYNCPAGHYSADANRFATSGIDIPPLHILATAEAGGNGVFRYGPAGTFPDQTWNATNYWVDVVFEPAEGTDSFRPTVVATTPQAGASGVGPGEVVSVTFSETIKVSTLNSSTLRLLDESNQVLPTTVTYNNTTRTATLTPSTSLAMGTTFSVVVKGGTGGVADLAGNTLAADVVWSFTTSTYGALAGGPGGPVLVVTDKSNPFSQYYAEILLAEGLNHFAIKDISEVGASLLNNTDVVILGAIALSDAQVTLFSNWVTQGGNLIAMRPDKKLAGLLGLVDAQATLAEGYLGVNTLSAPGAGIVAETIQYHGVADRYTLQGASSIATLYSNAQTATSNPAVTLREVGTNGGQAAAFTFDLARSIVLSRQGNPAWAGQERDGIAPLRSSDLFYGAASTDPQPDWIDLNKVAIPQADEQQRLLANLVLIMNADRKMLPRFWYFPHGHGAAVVMTGDDHANNGTKGRFDHEIDLSPKNGSVDDWETIRSTSYIFPNAGALTDTEAVNYTTAGFELALHLNTTCRNYTKESLETLVAQQIEQWRTAYPSLTLPVTNRTHCIAWSGYTIMAEVEAKYGIRLDTNYYYWPAAWVQNRPGFMTGSGMPMRFSTAEGNVLDIYQAATQMTDESGQTYPFTANQLLDKALGPEGFYGAFVANMHTDEVTSSGGDAIMLAAIDRGVPVISARQLLTWTDARNSSSIEGVQSSSTSLSFSIKANPAARGLKVMAPLPDGVEVSGVTYNGKTVPYFTRVIKGIPYAFIDALTGKYEISFGLDSTRPTVTGISPAAGATGVPINPEIAVVFSEPVNVETLTANNLVLLGPSNTAVAVAISYASGTGTATLKPTSSLSPGTAYTLRVKGGAGGVADMAGNSLATDFVSSFTTVSAPAGAISIWSDTTIPATIAVSDPKAVELGLKFRSSLNGRIRGIRFYKGPNNVGTHTGSLWTQTGTLLGRVTFTNESASGWQYQEFTTPVSITANTTYVVSYYTAANTYSASSNYFTTSAFENGVLRALSSAESGGNGLYRYGTAGGFPTQSFNATNYWVDVLFEATP